MSSETPSIDRIIGARIRAARQASGLTQKIVADALGVSVQQLQKYETGVNRVTPGVLVVLVERFRTTIGYFFEGLCASDLAPQIATPGAAAMRVALDFEAIPRPALQRSLSALIETLAETRGAADAGAPSRAASSPSDPDHRGTVVLSFERRRASARAKRYARGLD